MINIKENGNVDARQLHSKLEIKTRFNDWVRRVIEICGFEEGKEFYSNLSKTSSAGGRPSNEYEFTLDAAKEACIVGESIHASKLRKHLISLDNQTSTGELLNHEQILYVAKLKNVFKYLSNCDEARKMHMDDFVKTSSALNPYAEFNAYRSRILGLGKEKINERIREYWAEHSVLIKGKNNNEKLALLDKYEVLRNGVWDFLMSKHSDLAMNLANLAMKLAKIDGDNVYRKNETTIFEKKEEGGSIKNILN